ncbi:hypothetical protein [Pseudofulvibacter geojedonensis]|uniref:Uncharacterized protein n=1 Tax=Pseudofulvibacter geojedonensis TaxID=1123758 RepID=A0ABW3I324_9FLAO
MKIKTQIQHLISEILIANTIDLKRSLGNQTIELFKQANLINNTPVAIKLNTTLELKEAIDNFCINDNLTNRDALNNILESINQLLVDDKIAS